MLRKPSNWVFLISSALLVASLVVRDMGVDLIQLMTS